MDFLFCYPYCWLRHVIESKEPHLVSTHGISLRTQWAKLVRQALDEWVAEDALLGEEGWLENMPVSTMEGYWLGMLGGGSDGGILEQGEV